MRARGPGRASTLVSPGRLLSLPMALAVAGAGACGYPK
jgi:hypothetical protein